MSSTKLHMVDGKLRTTDEVAEMLGITRLALYGHMHRQKPASLQMIADMIRDGDLGTGKRPAERHRVHGEWMTVAQAAARLGVSVSAIQTWRQVNRRPDGSRGLLEEAWDHYAAVNAGRIKKYKPRESKLHWVRGKRMTVAQAADMIGVSAYSVRRYTSVHKCSVETAVKRLEAFHKRRTAREIMKIINGEG